MAKCIACKSDYTPGSPCPRCGANNGPWEKWQEKYRGLSGWLDFLAPGLYLPVFLTALTFPVGVAAAWALWLARQVAWPWVPLELSVLTLACIIIVIAIYEGRNRIRERELANRIRHNPSLLHSAQSRILVVPLVAIMAISAWTTIILSQPGPAAPEQNCLEHLLSTVQRDGPWSAATRHAVVDTLTLGGPLSIAALSYLSLIPALVYSSSLSLALRYADRMNQKMPLPIFLNTAKLARLVKSEAEQECSNLGPGLIWEGMERTDDGGIKLTARYCHDRKVLEDLAGKKTDLPMHTECEVAADRWGHVQSITPKSEVQV